MQKNARRESDFQPYRTFVFHRPANLPDPPTSRTLRREPVNVCSLIFLSSIKSLLPCTLPSGLPSDFQILSILSTNFKVEKLEILNLQLCSESEFQTHLQTLDG